MAIVKTYNQQVDAYGGSDVVQTLTQASTGTRVNRHGTTTISSAGSGTAADHAFIMDNPVKGVRKNIVVDINSTRTVTVFNASTATTFYGSTTNAVQFSTGTGAARSVNLVGVSTSQWAIVSQTTAVTTIASTVGA